MGVLSRALVRPITNMWGCYVLCPPSLLLPVKVEVAVCRCWVLDSGKATRLVSAGSGPDLRVWGCARRPPLWCVQCLLAEA